MLEQPAPNGAPSIAPRLVSIRLYVGLRTSKGQPIPRLALKEALAEVSETWENYTRTNAQGFYRGNPEPALVFERIAEDTEAERIDARALARFIATRTYQECVGLAFSPLESFTLEGPAT